jgi:hypothetical protein
MTGEFETGRGLSLVVVSLLKGVLYRDENPALWNKLLDLQAAVRDYLRIIGLELVIHEDEGFAWLKSMAESTESEKLPSLTVKLQLSYPVSLLLALLRRRLAEHDASSGESRLILAREDIMDLVKTFLPSGSNEARIMDQIDANINKVVDLGFIRRLKSENGKFEIRRILKAFIDAQWLNDFEKKLNEYIQSGNGTTAAEGEEE